MRKRLVGKWYWGRNDYGMGAKRPRMKVEAKRLGGKRLGGGNVLGAKRLVTSVTGKETVGI